MSDQPDQPAVPAELATPKAAADKIAELTAERDALRAQLAGKASVPSGPAAPGTIKMRVTGAHESMHHGGVTVGREWTEVPASYESRLYTAAQESGVELEQGE